MTGVKLTTRFKARGYELDSYQHVNNAVFLNYLEHGRWEYFRELNLIDMLKAQDNMPVVADIHIRYQREIRLSDEIEIISFCFHERPYLVFQQKIINLTTQMAAARATTKLIFVGHDRIVADVPHEVLSKINS